MTKVKDDGGIGNVLHIAEKIANDLAVLNRQSSTSAESAGTKRKVLDDSVRIEISQYSSFELKPIVEPLIKQLESINAAELLSLKPTRDGESGATLDSTGQTIEPIHDLVKPQYQNQSENNIVRYLHVKEIEHRYSAGIFVFPPNTYIPLHDHPDMVVISRILYGELYVTSYDVMPSSLDGEDHHSDCNDDEEESSPTSRQSPLRASFRKIKDLINRTLSYHHSSEEQQGNILHVKPNMKPLNCSPSSCDNSESMIISAPKVTCLYPHEGNCHSFRAGPHGVAVLDVLLPPYSDGSRDCTFYEKNIVQEHDEELYTLTPIEQPEDFHCVGGSIGKFGDRQHHDIGIDNV